MSRTIKQVRLEYDEKNLVLDETFPQDLEGILEEPDFEAVVRKINLELNQDILDAREELQKWSKVFACSAFLLVGLFFSPVVWVKSKHFKEALEDYWTQVEAYLKLVTKKSVAKRKDKWIEWKLNQSGYKKRGTDVFDPHFTWQVCIVVKARTKKGAAYVPKQLSKAPEPIEDDADTSITGFEGDAAQDAAGTEKRVSFVTPDEYHATPGPGPSSGIGTAAAVAGTAAVGAAAVAVGAALSASGENEKNEDLDMDENRVSGASTLSPITPDADNRLSGASTLSPVVIEDRRDSVASIDQVDIDNNRTSMVSMTSIMPLQSESSTTATAIDNRMSSMSLTPITGPPSGAGDRSSSLSLTPIVIQEAEEEQEIEVVEQAPTEVKPQALATVIEAEEESHSESNIEQSPEPVLSPTLTDVDEDFPAMPEEEGSAFEEDEDFPAMPEEMSGEDTSSIEALAMPVESPEVDDAEDNPEDLRTHILSDSESGSII